MSPSKSCDSRRIDELKKDIEVIREKVFTSDVKIVRIEESVNNFRKSLDENNQMTKNIYEKVNANSVSIAKIIGWGAGGGAVLTLLIKFIWN